MESKNINASKRDPKNENEVAMQSLAIELGLTVELEMCRARLRSGRDYLMQVRASEITVEDALEAFGFGRDGEL